MRDGRIYQSFKSGRDRGVDLRHSWGNNNTVVQCKHYARSGYDALLRDLKKEKFKLARLSPAPNRYVVSTSVDLSELQKGEVVAVFGPILSTRDVLGRDDLNNLLGLYPTVEKQHFKLWLSSTSVLDRVLHNAEATQSDFEVNRVRKTIERFVRSSAYPQAYEKLSADRIVIISGPPGVGKTTLADVLLYEHLQPVLEVMARENTLFQSCVRGGP